MHKDFHVLLPTFSADYAGAGAILLELGGVIVIHDPSGCIGNYTGYDEPRCYEGGVRVFTSGLDDIQALFGKDEDLVEACVKAYEQVGGTFVAIIGTPNPMILGTDYKAVAQEVSRRTGVPGFAVETTGTRYYGWGMDAALRTVMRELVLPRTGFKKGDPIPKGKRVNLLGATPLDVSTQPCVDTIAGILAQNGYEVASCWSMGTSLEQLDATFTASCNVVLCSSALPFAHWMKQEFGIPYVVGTFMGRKPVQRTIERIEAAIATGDAGGTCKCYGPADALKALVVHDAVVGEAIRRALIADCGFADAHVATFFDEAPELKRPGDLGVIGEDDLLEALHSGEYDLLVGDCLLEAFIPAGSNIRFAEVPHFAVSSRISWNKPINPYGEGIFDCLGERPA